MKSEVAVAAAIALLATIGSAQAAPCCGGSSAAPALITGDERATAGFALSQSAVIGDAPSEGLAVFRAPGDDEWTRTLRVEGALLLSDRWQAGLWFPWVQRELRRPGAHSDASGAGDLRAHLGYEILPEWEYSAWRPRGFAFFQLTVPTGVSVYEATAPGAVDATGRGFWALSAGTLLIKKGAAWDGWALPEARVILARKFSGASLGGGIGASLGFGAGRSFGAFRLGARVQPQWESSRAVTSSLGRSRTDRLWVWDTGLEASWMQNDALSWTASYVDQTLLGPARNTALNRTFALSVQHRWDR
ncbi:MAG: hypothetical protein IT285_06470 [Bdellovibrionales bacterium]|nr:hypothetical protein [Bdellovibrionales bacterium]